MKIRSAISCVSIFGAVLTAAPCSGQLTWANYKQTAQFAIKNRDTITAEAALETGLKLNSERKLADHQLVSILLSLAAVYEGKNQISNAEATLRKALHVSSVTNGEHNWQTADCYERLALFLSKHARLKEAASMYHHAAAAWAGCPSKEHSRLRNDYSSLGDTYTRLNQPGSAAQSYRLAMRVDSSSIGPNNSAFAEDVTKLAHCYRKSGNTKAMEHLYCRLLEQQQSAPGAFYPDLGDSFDNLALLYREQGRLKEEQALYEKILKIDAGGQGVNDNHMFNATGNLADCYMRRRLFSKAEPLYKQLLKYRSRGQSQGQEKISQFLNNYAEMLRRLNRKPEATEINRYLAHLTPVKRVKMVWR